MVGLPAPLRVPPPPHISTHPRKHLTGNCTQMSEPHVEGQHDAVTKPRATRCRDHAVLSYFRHTKPGQRLQLIDLGRKRPGLLLEQLQHWQPTGRPMRGWQLAAAEEAFSGGAQVVRAHMPHACNIEDEMRMAAVPRYDSRYLHLLNYNFRDWPGVTANPDGAAPPCCHSHPLTFGLCCHTYLTFPRARLLWLLT